MYIIIIKRLKNWYNKLFSSLHPMLTGGGSCGCCRWSCCLSASLLDAKKECIIICRGQSSWHNSCALWITTDLVILTVSHFCRLYFTHEEFCIWLGKIIFSRRFQQTAARPTVCCSSAKKKFQQDSLPGRRSNHTKCGHEIQPAGSEADPSLGLNDPQWCDWGHVILSSRFSDISFC